METWRWYGQPNTLALFIHILFLANWEDKDWHDVTIKRGSFITSVEHLAIESGLSIQQTRTALTNIQKTGEITNKTTNKYTIITVNKYDEYQPLNKQITNKQQTNNKQTTTTKDNKDNKEKEIIKKKFSTKEEITIEVMQSLADKYQVPLSLVQTNWDRVLNWEPNAPRKIKDYRATLSNFISTHKEKLLIQQKGSKNGQFQSVDVRKLS